MKQQNKARFQRSRRILITTFPIAILCAGVAAFALVKQPRSLWLQTNWSSWVNIYYKDGTSKIAKIDSTLLSMTYPEFRGIFAVEVIEFLDRDPEPYSPLLVPAPIPEGATAEFYKSVEIKDDFLPANSIIKLTYIDALSFRIKSRSRFIGRVWLRREVLWTLLGISAAATLFTGTRLFIISRPLRRLKRGLCTRCKYPLLTEQENPQCPECGTIHTMNAITATEAAAESPNASSPSESANNSSARSAPDASARGSE